MSNLNSKTSQSNDKKSIRKKKETKQSPVKNMEITKSSTQRSKITLNWNQFLLQQNSDVSKSVKKNRKPHAHPNSKLNDKNSKLQKLTPHAPPFTPQNYQPTLPAEFLQNEAAAFPMSANIFHVHPSYLSSAVAIDCEMVGIGDGRDNMLARVSIVDEHNNCVYDTFVKATEPVVDYRTNISGVRPQDMSTGREFKLVQKEVYDIIHGKILIGHGLSNDLKVLMLSHPKKFIRDTSKYKRFREFNKGATPALKTLAKLLLNVVIQEGEHSSIEDARAAMNLYLKYKNQWEKDIRTKYFH